MINHLEVVSLNRQGQTASDRVSLQEARDQKSSQVKSITLPHHQVPKRRYLYALLKGEVWPRASISKFLDHSSTTGMTSVVNYRRGGVAQ